MGETTQTGTQIHRHTNTHKQNWGGWGNAGAPLAPAAPPAPPNITESESSPGEVTVSVKIDGSAGELEGLDGGPVPSLRFRLVDGRIAAIGARLPAGEEESFGFVWEYSASADVPEVAPPLVATEVADVAALVGSGDRRPPDCAMTP